MENRSTLNLVTGAEQVAIKDLQQQGLVLVMADGLQCVDNCVAAMEVEENDLVINRKEMRSLAHIFE